MNYFAFLSVGVIAALLVVIATQYDIRGESIGDYAPQKIATAIKAEQRERVLIAREEHGIKVDEAVIAQWEGEKLNQFASVPTPTPSPLPEATPSAAFTTDAWWRVLVGSVQGLFDDQT